MMLDSDRHTAFALSAACVVTACRELERRVEDEGQVMANPRTVAAGGERRGRATHEAAASSSALGKAYLARLQPLAAAAQELRHHLEDLFCCTSQDFGNGSSPAPTRVLVVDDHDDMRDLVASTLRMAGLDVITSKNGLEAVIAAHTRRPALIVMDLQMPILNGIEATRLLKATPATRSVPVIAHTAALDLCLVHDAELFAHIMRKPTDPNVLVALVRHLVTVDTVSPRSKLMP